MPKRAPALVEAVLARLGLAAAPEPDLEGLRAVYGAWCRRVPFDNLQKRIHLKQDRPGPLPGDRPEAFFRDWLASGAGGTCWAGNGALAALLSQLGFRTERALATMLVAPGLPPNHGTVVVHLDQGGFLADASILHGEPLPLPEDGEGVVDHPGFGARVRCEDGHYVVAWRPLHLERLDCRIDEIGFGPEVFSRYHEETRGWSPFNFSLSLRVMRGEESVGFALGKAARLDARGRLSQWECQGEERIRFLVEELGIAESLARRLPADEPLPPPPGSRTAARQSGAGGSPR